MAAAFIIIPQKQTLPWYTDLCYPHVHHMGLSWIVSFQMEKKALSSLCYKPPMLIADPNVSGF